MLYPSADLFVLRSFTLSFPAFISTGYSSYNIHQIHFPDFSKFLQASLSMFFTWASSNLAGLTQVRYVPAEGLQVNHRQFCLNIYRWERAFQVSSGFLCLGTKRQPQDIKHPTCRQSLSRRHNKKVGGSVWSQRRMWGPNWPPEGHVFFFDDMKHTFLWYKRRYWTEWGLEGLFLFVRLFVCLFVCLFVWLFCIVSFFGTQPRASVGKIVGWLWRQPVGRSFVCLFFSLSVCLFVPLFVCLLVGDCGGSQSVTHDSRRSIILKYDIVWTESSIATHTGHRMENYPS